MYEKEWLVEQERYLEIIENLEEKNKELESVKECLAEYIEELKEKIKEEPENIEDFESNPKVLELFNGDYTMTVEVEKNRKIKRTRAKEGMAFLIDEERGKLLTIGMTSPKHLESIIFMAFELIKDSITEGESLEEVQLKLINTIDKMFSRVQKLSTIPLDKLN